MCSFSIPVLVQIDFVEQTLYKFQGNDDANNASERDGNFLRYPDFKPHEYLQKVGNVDIFLLLRSEE